MPTIPNRFRCFNQIPISTEVKMSIPLGSNIVPLNQANIPVGIDTWVFTQLVQISHKLVMIKA
jgi:hypothetical protein